MNAIAAVDQHWAIGREGELLFSLPSDRKHFRTLTLGGTVIMGRKTLDGFPGGQPLPDRRNLVITHNPELQRQGIEIVSSPEQALAAVENCDPEQIWIIGGGSIYAAFLRRCKRVYLTQVDAVAEDPDTFFPNLDRLPGWSVERRSEPITENGLTYRFVDYVQTNL